MLDINLIRKEPERVRQALQKKVPDVSLDEFLEKDAERRALISSIESKKAEKNRINKEIPAVKREGGDIDALLARSNEISQEIARREPELQKLEDEVYSFLIRLPNMPDDDVVSGGKENNAVVSVYGEKPVFDFEPKDHMSLSQELGLVDYTRGAKISGNGFWVYTGLGARLEWALINFFIDQHIQNGYQFNMIPFQLDYSCGFGAGQFPKFGDEVYWIESDENKNRKFLLPTAETALVNIHANEILSPSDLPIKYCAYSPCFRKEAGGYGSAEKGMIRGHQFNKVEMVQYTLPEQANEVFYQMVGHAESLLQKLGLHYHVSKLAAQDCSASMARTYDVEVYLPSMGDYKEVSSVSNANDYQARRMNCRYRNEDGSLGFVSTLNGSGLATSRVFPAILEQFQNADGSVRVPEVLQPFMGGMELISKES